MTSKTMAGMVPPPAEPMTSRGVESAEKDKRRADKAPRSLSGLRLVYSCASHFKVTKRVVEKKAETRNHHARAKKLTKRGGVRNHVSISVDHGNVGCRGLALYRIQDLFTG